MIYLLICAISLAGCTAETKLGKLRQELMEVDSAFSLLSSEVGMNRAFETYCADEGVLLRPGSMPIIGIESVKETLARTDDAAFELTWEPLYAGVAKSHDMGYTYGVYTVKPRDSDAVENGTYVSIWIKERGSWKFILDTGNQGTGD